MSLRGTPGILTHLLTAQIQLPQRMRLLKIIMWVMMNLLVSPPYQSPVISQPLILHYRGPTAVIRDQVSNNSLFCTVRCFIIPRTYFKDLYNVQYMLLYADNLNINSLNVCKILLTVAILPEVPRNQNIFLNIHSLTYR